VQPEPGSPGLQTRASGWATTASGCRYLTQSAGRAASEPGRVVPVGLLAECRQQT